MKKGWTCWKHTKKWLKTLAVTYTRAITVLIFQTLLIYPSQEGDLETMKQNVQQNLARDASNDIGGPPQKNYFSRTRSYSMQRIAFFCTFGKTSWKIVRKQRAL